jgi:hypothetical protein
MTLGSISRGRNALIKLFVRHPVLRPAGTVPIAWGWGLSALDVGLSAFFYFLTLTGITVGYHRYFHPHRGFKALRPLRIALAVLGSNGPSRAPSSGGRRPPPPPRLRRQRGRPALAVAVRHTVRSP